MHFRLRFIRSLEGQPLGVFLGRGGSEEVGEIILELPMGSDYPSEAEILFDPVYCPDLIEGDLFVVVTTDIYPQGEVRGQIEETCAEASVVRSWGRIRTLYR
jgi:hypothetical protein